MLALTGEGGTNFEPVWNFADFLLFSAEDKITEPIILAQQKGHERIGEAWKPIRRAS
jgi:hypothetical protein